MFKIIGLFFLVRSSTVLVCRKNMTYKKSYRFLSQTQELLKYIELYCFSGMSYRQIINKASALDLSYYKQFDISDRNNYFDNLSGEIASERLNKAGNIFSSLGRNGAKREKEYIKISIEEINTLSEKYKQKYEKDRQINIIAGASLGIMIFIALI